MIGPLSVPLIASGPINLKTRGIHTGHRTDAHSIRDGLNALTAGVIIGVLCWEVGGG